MESELKSLLDQWEPRRFSEQEIDLLKQMYARVVEMQSDFRELREDIKLQKSESNPLEVVVSLEPVMYLQVSVASGKGNAPEGVVVEEKLNLPLRNMVEHLVCPKEEVSLMCFSKENPTKELQVNDFGLVKRNRLEPLDTMIQNGENRMMHEGRFSQTLLARRNLGVRKITVKRRYHKARKKKSTSRPDYVQTFRRYGMFCGLGFKDCSVKRKVERAHFKGTRLRLKVQGESKDVSRFAKSTRAENVVSVIKVEPGSTSSMENEDPNPDYGDGFMQMVIPFDSPEISYFQFIGEATDKLEIGDTLKEESFDSLAGSMLYDPNSSLVHTGFTRADRIYDTMMFINVGIWLEKANWDKMLEWLDLPLYERKNLNEIESFMDCSLRLRLCNVTDFVDWIKRDHWHVLSSSDIALELDDKKLYDDETSGSVIWWSMIWSTIFDGPGERDSGLAHLASIQFLTLRLVVVNQGLLSPRVRVEMLEQDFDACDSLLENTRQPWKKSLIQVLSWLRPEVITSEVWYGTRKEEQIKEQVIVSENKKTNRNLMLLRQCNGGSTCNSRHLVLLRGLSVITEEWLLLDKESDTLRKLNLIIVGHVHSEEQLQGKGFSAYAWAWDESCRNKNGGLPDVNIDLFSSDGDCAGSWDITDALQNLLHEAISGKAVQLMLLGCDHATAWYIQNRELTALSELVPRRFKTGKKCDSTKAENSVSRPYWLCHGQNSTSARTRLGIILQAQQRKLFKDYTPLDISKTIMEVKPRYGAEGFYMEDVCYYKWPLPKADKFGLFSVKMWICGLAKISLGKQLFVFSLANRIWEPGRVSIKVQWDLVTLFDEFGNMNCLAPAVSTCQHVQVRVWTFDCCLMEVHSCLFSCTVSRQHLARLLKKMNEALISVATNKNLALELKLAVGVLVDFCPCVTGLATPTAILMGTSHGAKMRSIWHIGKTDVEKAILFLPHESSDVGNALLRGYWDRLGQVVLSFLGNRKENRAGHKGASVAVSILNDTSATQMQQLLGFGTLAKIHRHLAAVATTVNRKLRICNGNSRGGLLKRKEVRLGMIKVLYNLLKTVTDSTGWEKMMSYLYHTGKGVVIAAKLSYLVGFLIYEVFHFLRPPEQLQSKMGSWNNGQVWIQMDCLLMFHLEDKVVL